ncbi:Mitochondrial protein cyt-4 [Metarhizium album ARSEF 1941]|uniref:Mitochondrial protein cyt-4 n=1 Tax=Metarhizium album (strain ARSEF 1941) TaxID=1081103 RepID=A0A0B2WKI0_METAS|nr:Mitochondrial protein cyt-4 [Metarhizium album ARSEF 1941]KHN94169.1 Mitochondrial protein cyt-4 [Metarhizium album ARSEF 1941]
MPSDACIDARIVNNISRTQSTGSSEFDQLRSTARSTTDMSSEGPTNDSAEASIVGSDSRSPGDLVELIQQASRVPMFAIYLGYFGDRNHFYALNGKWITSMGYSPLFTVSNFVTPPEMQSVLAKIPKDGTPEHFDELRNDDKGPLRQDGVHLITKMTKFRTTSEEIYQGNMAKLDGARELLSSARRVKYLSLFEIADMLLPENLKGEDGFSPPALYAVHTALSRSDIAFSPLSPSADCHRRDHLFEVFPQNHAHVAAKVAAWVRQYTDSSAKKSRPLNDSELEEIALGRFVIQAREAVYHSRQTREWTPHGILKTSPSVTLPKVDWSPVSKDVISFLEWWASYDLFGAGSRFHSYGALILRSLCLYDNATLDQSTAWTFLQEIGVIAPWEIASRYRVRFPGTTIARGGGISRPKPQDLLKSTRPDIAEGSRKMRTGSRIFCIDAPSTMIIDDGVSLERTDQPGEFWIHVHVADPASAIQPDSELGRFMELIPENIYLPGHFQAMLPSELGEDDSKDYKSESLVQQYSLGPGCPALTFSAKVSDAGDVLDYRVEPSTLGEVTYLDPKDVAEFCGEQTPPFATGYNSLEVGTPPDASTAAPERNMTSVQELDGSSQEDILTLYRLAESIKQKRLSKGAWPYFFPRPSVQVCFHDAIPEAGATQGATSFPPDPYIKVGTELFTGCSVVSNTMVLAGEIAARWCSDRGIPIPYRKDVKSAENLEAALNFATKEVYPLINQGIEPSATHRQELSRLTGGIQISSEPGPYFLLGVDMYAKATSPLRRFSDLLVHWQIHAALAYERKVQRRIDATSDALDDILPFSTASLRTTLPLLFMRERMAKTVSRGTVDWILIALVRAWRFEDKAPRTLRFTVSSRGRQGLLGRLDMFDLSAAMDVAGLNGCRLVRDIHAGDEFEVELVDVNVHSRQILVKALRCLGGQQPLGSGNTAPAGAVADTTPRMGSS